MQQKTDYAIFKVAQHVGKKIWTSSHYNKDREWNFRQRYL